MSAAKRARACDACHSIKIKCELGSTGGLPPCERCSRLEKDCVVSPPKRQKDRIAELEAQVAALTKQLQGQSIGPSPPETVGSSEETDSQSVNEIGLSSKEDTTPQQILPSKKRRLEDTPESAISGFPKPSNNQGLEFDAVVSRDSQRRLMRKYVDEIMPITPLIPIPGDWDYERLRKDKPILLQAIMYAASTGVLLVESQEEIAKIMMDIFASKAIAEGQKSVELVQALQVAILWFRSPKHHAHVAAFQLIQVAAGLAEDIGLGGPQSSPSLGFSCTIEDVTVADGWRTWLVCHMLSASTSIFMRRPNGQTWKESEDLGAQILSYSEYGISSDKLVYQFVRAERLCETIVSRLHYCDFSTIMDVSDPFTKLNMAELQNLIIDWKVHISPELQCPALTFWELLATMHLHELVLHTPTNKQSFAAPYLVERLSITDFPAPIVVQEHIDSLYALKTNAHQLLDLFATLDVTTLMALPAFLFVSRVAYANYILVKIYISLTAQGNTFHGFLDPESLKIEEYLDKIIRIAEMVSEFDERCAAARVLFSAARMKAWYLNYKNPGLEHPPNVEKSDTYTILEPSSTGEQIPMNWNELEFGDDTLNFGLDEIFADPPVVDWFPEPLQQGGLIDQVP